MSEERSAKPRKKRRSLWWLWLLLLLAAYTGGIVTGLKLNTLPLPQEVKEKLYPVLESYIPGSTQTRGEETAEPAPTPEPTPAPTPTPAPAETPAPVETAEPVAEEPAAAPELEGEPLPVEQEPEPEKTAAASFIGVNRALEIAMEQAGAEERTIENTSVARVTDENVYKVSFTVDGVSYSYTIDAVTGEVRGEELSGLSFTDAQTYAEPDAAPET